MPPVIPVATYRLQLSAKFGFREAAALVPYLRALGVSHLYASPFLKARAGSTHGYDIIDHSQLNPEFGGTEGFLELSQALADADLGLILDFVPNHMGVGHADNGWWLDVLEWGPKSPHADSFDIDWHGISNRREAGVLLPILGKPYSEALESGEISLKFDAVEGSFSAWYFDHCLPIRPNRYAEILRTVAAAANGETQQLLEIAEDYSGPTRPSYAQAPALKAALAASGAGDAIERGLAAYNNHTVALHRLLERQYYRLAHWRSAVSEINYRRFFDISDLAGIRVEDWKTFRAVHHLVAALIADGRLHGLRIDHIDGLADPIQYCRRLQRLARRSRPTPSRFPFYIVVEKILAADEAMPAFPGVAGTTGYEALNEITRVLLDDRGLPALDDIWRQISGRDDDFAATVQRAKHHVIDNLMASEFTVLTRLLARIAAGHWPSRDYTHDRLRAALTLYVVHFPVYRTYIATAPSAEDRAMITRTVEKARADWTGPDANIFDFIQDALTLDLIAPDRTGYSSARVRQFSTRMQQFTGPVTAKAIEDTAFYRYHRLVALNEVGGDPAHSALSPSAFHDRMRTRAERMPHALTATATHDTKRGEDARMRILALAELADDWSRAVAGWRRLNARDGAPTAAHEYLIYQALIGSWPNGGPDDDFVERMQGFVIKAAREGKQQTSWFNPNADYESALTDFVARILRNPDFVRDFEGFAARPHLLGALNSLSQLVLKATMPGVPDFYQGTEDWDLSLVDPDNRRPVDFTARQVTPDADWDDLARDWRSGRIKHALTAQLLRMRRERAAVFAHGRYEPVAVSGKDADWVIAFARRGQHQAVIVAVGRHFATATERGREWPQARRFDATLDLSAFRDLSDLSGRTIAGSVQVPVADLFRPLPLTVIRARSR